MPVKGYFSLISYYWTNNEGHVNIWKYSSTATFVWSKNTFRKRVHTNLSSVAGTLCVYYCDDRKTHTGVWQVCLSDQQVSPSIQNYRPYIVFQLPRGNMNTPLRRRIFCFRQVIGTYILPIFSGNLLITFLTIVLYFSLSCETTLLMLSCDRIESAKFIHGTPSPAKPVYYSPKLQHYGSLIIRLFSVISRTLVRGVLHLGRDAVSVFYTPSRPCQKQWRYNLRID